MILGISCPPHYSYMLTQVYENNSVSILYFCCAVSCLRCLRSPPKWSDGRRERGTTSTSPLSPSLCSSAVAVRSHFLSFPSPLPPSMLHSQANLSTPRRPRSLGALRSVVLLNVGELCVSCMHCNDEGGDGHGPRRGRDWEWLPQMFSHTQETLKHWQAHALFSWSTGNELIQRIGK